MRGGIYGRPLFGTIQEDVGYLHIQKQRSVANVHMVLPVCMVMIDSKDVGSSHASMTQTRARHQAVRFSYRQPQQPVRYC